MSAAREDRARARYARAIERRWTERLERPIVLSPRDWTRISEWHERGIPLPLVLESIDAALETRRRPGAARPRSLAYVAPLVDESWRVVVDGRRVPAEPRGAPASAPGRLDSWRKRRDAQPHGSSLRQILERLVLAVETGSSPEAVDQELDATLAGAVPRDLASEATRAAEHDVARLRGRVPHASIERARSLAVASWLRRRLALPRLVS